MTPKFSAAELNRMGVALPAWNASTSNSRLDSMTSPASSTALDQSSPWLSAACSGVKYSVRAMFAPALLRWNRANRSLRRSHTPRKSPEMPTAQVSGMGWSPVRSVISSMSASGSRPGRSHLLMTVMMGRFRCLQTSKSFMVCVSRPFAASTSITAQSTAASTR